MPLWVTHLFLSRPPPLVLRRNPLVFDRVTDCEKTREFPWGRYPREFSEGHSGRLERREPQQNKRAFALVNTFVCVCMCVCACISAGDEDDGIKCSALSGCCTDPAALSLNCFAKGSHNVLTSS